MSGALAYAGVTAVLKDLLDTGVIDHRVTDALGQGVTVSALAPDAIVLGNDMGARLNLFMHQVTPNAAWRNVDYPALDSAGRRVANPPLAVDLHYLLTAYSNTDLQAEVLLGYAMQLFHETPVLAREAIRTALNPPSPPVGPGLLPTIYNALRASDLADQYEQIKITPSVMNTEELSKLWTAMQAHYRPTAAYQVTVVLIRSQFQARSGLPVLSRNLKVNPSMIPPIPEVQGITYQVQQTAAQIGEQVELDGHDLDGAQHVLQLTNDRLGFSATVSPPLAVTPGAVTFTLPASPTAIVAGIHIGQLSLVRAGDPAAVLTNAFPVTIAPQLLGMPPTATLDPSGDLTLTPGCAPQVRPNQTVSLLLGSIEAFAEPFTTPTGTPSFVFHALPAGTYRARLRVDGVDSIVIDRAPDPPVFIGPELQVLP